MLKEYENSLLEAKEKKPAGIMERLRTQKTMEPAVIGATGSLVVGFAIIAFMVPSVTMGLITEEFTQTAEGFEQWAIQNPSEASTLMDEPVNLDKVSYMVTGVVEDGMDLSTVEYIPQENGNYDLCFAPVTENWKSYIYSSETGEFAEKSTCDG